MQLCRYFCNRWYFLHVFKEPQPGISTSVLNMHDREVVCCWRICPPLLDVVFATEQWTIMIKMTKCRCCQRLSCSLFPCSYFVSAMVTSGLMNSLSHVDSVHNHFGPTRPTQGSKPDSSCRRSLNHCAYVKIPKYAFKYFNSVHFGITTNANSSLSYQQATLTDSAVEESRRCSSAL